MWTTINGARYVTVGCLGLALGCRTGELEPAQSANEVTPGMALSSVGPVRITAEGTWDGDNQVTKHVTPVRLTIRNGWSRAVDIRHSNIALVSADERRFEPLRLSEISGTIETAVDRLAERSGYQGRGEPYFGIVYQDVEVRPPVWMQSLEYYDHLYDNFIAELPLPTPDMRAMALPEARVDAKGVLSGYVYFEHVPRSVGLVTLRVDVLDAETGQSLGTAAIPFAVD